MTGTFRPKEHEDLLGEVSAMDAIPLARMNAATRFRSGLHLVRVEDTIPVVDDSVTFES